MRPPPGFAPVTLGPWSGWVRSDLVEAARAAGLSAPEQLAAAAAVRFGGRTGAFGFRLGPLDAVYRRAAHGGRLARLTGELFLTRRTFAEAGALAQARARGAPCPEPLAALARPGPLGLTRLALVTAAIPGARPAPEFFAALPRGAVTRRRRVLAALGRAVRALHDAGVEHFDLNANNLLVDPAGRAFVVDLDRATLHEGPVTAGPRVANLRRLARSWKKLDPGGRTVSARDALAFARAYGGGKLRGLPAGAPGARRLAFGPLALAYDLAWLAAGALLLPLMALAGTLGLARARAWRERFALVLPARPGRTRPILVHGASVGEAVSAAPLVAALHQAFPGVPVVLSTLSESGREAALAKGIGDRVVLFPADMPWVRDRWLDRLAPRAVIVLETELWSGLYRACHARGLPLVAANARIAPNRVERYRTLSSFFAPLMAVPDLFAMQSPADRERILRIGAPPGRVRCPGDLKYDQVLANLADPRRAGLARAFAGVGPRLVAGSLHPGEEGPVLDAYLAVRARHPDLRLTLAPRHLAKLPVFVAALEARGIAFARRREGRAAPVLLLDTMGELALAYEGATAAFVGGSFVPVGGHSPLEPAVFGVPVAFGPQAYNFETMNRALVEAGGASVVADGPALAAWWEGLLARPEAASAAGRAARAGLDALGGAAARTAGWIRARWPGLAPGATMGGP